MGAGTTVQIAAEYPLIPKAIVLEDPGWRKEKEPAADRESFVKSLMEYSRMTLEEVIAEGKASNPLWSDAEIRPWAVSKLQFDPSLFTVMRSEMPSYVEQVPKIQCPTLLITAENGIVSVATAEHASSLWVSGKLFQSVRINGAGHNIRREQFAEFMIVLENFLIKIST